MSRTDKDAPAWVRATYYRPQHHLCCAAGRNGQAACTLPAHPVRTQGAGVYRPRQCSWQPVRDWWMGSGWHAGSGFIDPERAQSRNELRRAAQEHNGSGDTNVIPTAGTRRRGRWDEW